MINYKLNYINHNSTLDKLGKDTILITLVNYHIVYCMRGLIVDKTLGFRHLISHTCIVSNPNTLNTFIKTEFLNP